MKTLTVQAERSKLDTVQNFVSEELEQIPCTPQAQMQIQIAVEELFVNIASYAYAPGRGEVLIGCQVEREPPSLTIQFRDRGKPFDPLAQEDADVTLPAEKRRIGGLGIYMVKTSMDSLTYRYEDGQNIVTMKKNL